MIDWTRVGYQPPGGGWVPLARRPTTPGAGSPVNITLTSVTERTLSDVTAHITGADADLTGVRWDVTPAPDTYGRQRLTGTVCTFKHAVKRHTVTVTVPRKSGGTPATATLEVEKGAWYQAGVFPRAYTWGETVAVEDTMGFETARTYTARLIRTASPGVPTERTLIAEQTVNFTAGAATRLRYDFTPTRPPGDGAGYEFRWELDLGQGRTVRSQLLPVWVYGTGLTRQRQSQAPDSIDYPGIYTRRAADSGMVTPAAGKTYADHQAKFCAEWRADHLGGSAPGGAWLSIKDYNANLWWVDLDDTTIPRVTFTFWDTFERGWNHAGWYGDDPSAQPYPRSRVATNVPVPANATPSPGTDRSMTIVGMRNGRVERIWEFWLAQKLADGSWRAANIGSTTWADDWRHSRNYTVAASGISAVAYALKVKEAQSAVAYVKSERAAGRIPSEAEIVRRVPHALAINQANPLAGSWTYPATYSDGGSTDPTTPQEGQLAWIREDADIPAANLTPLKHVIAVVGKHRGLRVTDKTAWNTSLIVEGDQSYGGGIWTGQILEPGESWAVKYPNDWFVIGRQYRDKAAFDADTTLIGADPVGCPGTWTPHYQAALGGTTLPASLTPHRGLPPYTNGVPLDPATAGSAYDPANVTVVDGRARLAWTATPTTAGGVTYPYRSATIHADLEGSLTRGYVEAAIYVPATPGVRTQFSLYAHPADPQAALPVVDIADIRPDTNGTTRAHFTYKPAAGTGTGPTAYGAAATGWHTYGLLWEGTRFQTFIDGVPGVTWTGTTPKVAMYPAITVTVDKGSSPPAGAVLVDYLNTWGGRAASTATVTANATVTGTGAVTVTWQPPVEAYIERDGTDINGGGKWGTTATGSQSFTLLRPGDTYTFTIEGVDGSRGVATATIPTGSTPTPTPTGPVFATKSPTLTAGTWTVPTGFTTISTAKVIDTALENDVNATITTAGGTAKVAVPALTEGQWTFQGTGVRPQVTRNATKALFGPELRSGRTDWASGMHHRTQRDVSGVAPWEVGRGRPGDLVLRASIPTDQGWGTTTYTDGKGMAWNTWVMTSISKHQLGQQVVGMAIYPSNIGIAHDTAAQAAMHDRIIAGEFDWCYTQMAKNLVSKGLGSAIVRIDWEANGGWYTHGTCNVSNAGKHGQAVARAAATMLKVAPDLKFSLDVSSHVWIPETGKNGMDWLRAYDPQQYAPAGVTVRHLIVCDIYFTYDKFIGTNPTYDQFLAMLRPTNGQKGTTLAHCHDYALEKNIPLGIGEWGIVDTAHNGGGDTPAYIEHMHRWCTENKQLAYEGYWILNDPTIKDLQTDLRTLYPQAWAKYVELWGGGSTAVPDPTPTPVTGTLTASATVTGTGAVTVTWQPPVEAYIERDGTDINGGGKWGTTATGSQSFTLLRPGDTYTFTITASGYTTATVKATIPADTTTPAPAPTPAPTSLPATKTFIPFAASNGASATYHLWTTGRSVGDPLLIWLHGDAAFEHKNPTSTYCFGGTNGVTNVCLNRGIVFASALAPDTTGTVTWWEDPTRNVPYLADLITRLTADIAPSKIYLAGFSGGAQFITQYFLPQKSATLPTGGSVVMGGGGKPVTPSAPTFNADFKAGWWMNWTTGALDDAAHSSEGYDALAYAKAGQQWYANAGFRTSTYWPGSITHDLSGRFGGYLARVLDAPPA